MVYLVSSIIIFCALMPSSLYFQLSTSNMYLWTFLVLASGFAGFFLLFQKVNPFIKTIAIAGFINCFFSLSFQYSATAYMALVGGCYFYWACAMIEDWNLVFKVLLTLIIFNCFFMGMQALGRDSLLNFGMGKNLVCYGTTGARMCVESLLIVASALVFQSRYRMALWGMFFAAVLYLIIYKTNAASQGGFLHSPFGSRIPVWKETIAFANQYPWGGWGIGTFKILYHPMSKLHTLPWYQAHNEYLQVLFETGRLGLLLMLGYLGNLIWKLKNKRQFRLLTGLSMILLDMMVHFPLREFQCFLIVIAFLAYCETRLNDCQIKQP